MRKYDPFLILGINHGRQSNDSGLNIVILSARGCRCAETRGVALNDFTSLDVLSVLFDGDLLSRHLVCEGGASVNILAVCVELHLD